MRRNVNLIVPLLAALTFVAIRLLWPNMNSWAADSPSKILVGAVCVALVTCAICAIIDWVSETNRSRPKS